MYFLLVCSASIAQSSSRCWILDVMWWLVARQVSHVPRNMDHGPKVNRYRTGGNHESLKMHEKMPVGSWTTLLKMKSVRKENSAGPVTLGSSVLQLKERSYHSCSHFFLSDACTWRRRCSS